MKPIHVIVVLVVLLILFGAPKLPVFARSLGKSLRILKEEAKALTSDDDASKPTVEDEANDK
jgi:sec-independent protein translocase protein TatA